MSEFDEEAEREKLRKQFEADKRKRESTERMSELLLQGATMTDTHCDSCGDPLFRYEGQEFCPTCQVRTDGYQSTDTQQSSAETEPSESAQPTTSAQIDVEDETTPSDDPPNSGTATTTPTDTPTASADTPSGSDLSAARQSLMATVTRFAKRAETTEDPDRSRKFLAATEDAASALDALNEASR